MNDTDRIARQILLLTFKNTRQAISSEELLNAVGEQLSRWRIMNVKRQGEMVGVEAWRYFMLESPPSCVSCERGITKYPEAGFVDIGSGKRELICMGCRERYEQSRIRLSIPCTVEQLRRATNAEEVMCADQDTLANAKREAAKHFRSERATKAAEKRTARRNEKADRGTGRSAIKVRRPITDDQNDD